jgi:O-antigen/teichoic acid export membrane protein
MMQPPTQAATDSWTPTMIVEKVLKGAVALVTRQFLVQGLMIAGGVLLARILSPTEFGLYAIITFVMNFLKAFSDAGLGASLIRHPTEPSIEEYRAVFTMQQIIVALIVLLFWMAAPLIAHAYHLPNRDAWLFRLVALSLLATSFQVIPSIRLERHLAFDKLAMVEVAQAVTYNALAVGLAWWGLGAMSFALALLARSLVGAVLAAIVSPWPIGWRWDWASVRGHLRYGLPYQGANLVYPLKDSIMPVFVGLLLGAGQVGYLEWAGMIAAYPVMGLMVFYRLYLPAFSRMQAHREQLGRFVEHILRATNGLVAPFAMLTLALIHPLTRIVFGEQWLAALPLFYPLWAANFFIASATPLMGLLNALGNSRIVFGFALLWMFGTWALGVPLILLYGTLGFALANVGVQLTNILLYRIAQRHVPFRILPLIAPLWGWAGLVGMWIYVMQRVLPISSLAGLVGYAAAGLALYTLGLLALYPTEARRGWIWIRSRQWMPASRS